MVKNKENSDWHSNELSLPEAHVAFFSGNNTLSSANDFLLCTKAEGFFYRLPSTYAQQMVRCAVLGVSLGCMSWYALGSQIQLCLTCLPEESIY